MSDRTTNTNYKQMKESAKKVLIIQTAFIGDVILATPIIEALSKFEKNYQIDFLIRKGNEALVKNHPLINKIWIWDKKNGKLKNQFALITEIRKKNYDTVINLQRFLSSGIFTWLSGAKNKIGFNKNPLSFTFDHTVPHRINKAIHEVDRNLSLLSPLGITANTSMKLYPSEADYAKVSAYQKEEYIVLAPTSVWFTKQFPKEKWIDFINIIPNNYTVYCIGGPNDSDKIHEIIKLSTHRKCVNLCGKLSLLESTALMEYASMNYVNDSAPMHMASATNAAVTAIFCSTVTDFGFGPRSSRSYVVETKEELKCRPCGLHGKVKCPEDHFKCAKNIDIKELILILTDDRKGN